MIRQRSRRSSTSRLLESLESRTLFSAALPTTTSLVASVGGATVGQTVTFTASVSSQDNSLDGQWVQLWENNTLFIGSAQLVDNTATINWTAVSGGLHSIAAEFPAQGDFDRSISSPVEVLVFRHAATVSLSASELPGGKVQLEVTVTANEPLPFSPTGKLDIFENNKLLATITLGSAGSLPLKLSQGTHFLTAGYRGDSAFFPATTSQEVSVEAPAATRPTSPSPSPELDHSHRRIVIKVVAATPPASARSTPDSISAYISPQSRQFYGSRSQASLDTLRVLAIEDELQGR